MAAIAELWRFPVKSMGGERLDRAEIGAVGIVGDRAFGVVDLDTGNTLTARRAPELLMASARLIDGRPVVTVDHGRTLDDDAALSAWLGRPVELRAADAESGGTYEVPLDFENDAEWVSWTGPGAALHDSGRSRVSLVSRTSLRDWDQRRFRTNVILDGAGEDGWVGSRVRLGAEGTGPVLTVQKQIDRCVMVTRPQPGLDRDLDVLRTINAERSTFLAIGALVEAAGAVAVGDEVEVLGEIPAR